MSDQETGTKKQKPSSAEQKKPISKNIMLYAGLGVGATVIVILLVVLLVTQLGGGYDKLGASNPSITHPDGLTFTITEGGPLQVRLDAVPRELALNGRVPRAFSGAMEALPSYLDLKSPLYTIDVKGGEAKVDIEVVIPNDSEPYQTLDLYRWDAEAGEWLFVPNQVDMMAGVVHTDEIVGNLAVFQTRSTTPLISTILEPGDSLNAAGAAVLNLVLPTGYQLQPDGSLVGAPAAGWQPGAGYAVTPVVAGDSASVTSMLYNPASLALHIEDLRMLTINSGYNGIALDYQGLSPTDREAFALFVSELADALHKSNKVLVVLLPQPTGGGTSWDTGGYDWRAIGAAADVVVIQDGIRPADYAANGPAFNMLTWAVGEVSRYKIHLASSVKSYDETNNVLISFEDAIAPLGVVTVSPALPEGSSAYQSGTQFTFNLSGALSEVGADQNTGAYTYTVTEETGPRRIWIVSANAVRARLDMFSNYNLGGMFLQSFGSPGNDSGLIQAITEFKVKNASSLPSQFEVEWTLTDASGASLTQRTGVGTPWAWRADFPGAYTVQGGVAGGQGNDRGAVGIQISDSGVEIAEAAATAAPVYVQPAAGAAATQTTPTVAEEQPAATEAPPAPVVGSAAVGGFELGGQTHTLGHPDAMRQAGMSWVKFQIKWVPGTDPSVAAGKVATAHSNGFKVLLSIPGPSYPSSIDYGAYISFLSGVASYGPDAIEVWNEMNLEREWPVGQISGSSYVTNMLAPAYNAIKSASPGTLVISGAPAPTGVNIEGKVMSDDQYLAQMRDAGAASYMDCVGVHYNEGIIAPSQTSGDPRDAFYSRYYYGMLNLYYGTLGKQVCFTELGYLTPEGYGALPANFAWAGNTTIAEQAAWLAEAAVLSGQSGKVRLMIVFNVDFDVWQADDPQAGYAIVRADGSCPACSSLGGVMH